MASVFTYDPDPPRVSSPWSTPGSSTPHRKRSSAVLGGDEHHANGDVSSNPNSLVECGITKLDPEPQEGPTEYKLHILLRPRRSFLALSTGSFIPGSSHSRSSPAVPEIPQDLPESGGPSTLSWSSQSRQRRLHQLTTQLLWRLQQSSPFHSSSAANLVLPVLPDPTPTLKVPRVLSPLLPGLEESQGALYEIGVSDDGSFVGLAEDELNESIINLEAMAASLGCKVEVLRRVVVGHGEWATSDASSPDIHSGKLWVAEALVSPELKRHSLDSLVHPGTNGSSASIPSLGIQSNLKPTEQLHVAIAGPTGAGKSSLLGILSTSAFDNGRGKSRLSLLKHRHEIASGVTSSIAQELIGYSEHGDCDIITGRPDVLNYADGNIASWNDIHASANGGRLVFLSDLPGSLKYSKSALRGLVSWRPHYVLLCVPASKAESSEPTDTSSVDISVAYLELCVKLELPIVVVLTKLDSALRSNLRETLNRILTTIKLAGKEPVMVRAAEAAEQDLDLRQISEGDRQDISSATSSVSGRGIDSIPIIMTSAVTGSGIGKLHALLRDLPLPKTISAEPLLSNGSNKSHPESKKTFDINEVFEMPLFKVYSLSNENKRKDDRGIILCGCMRAGNISVGDRLVVGPIPPDSRSESDLNNLAAPRPRTTSSRAPSDIVAPRPSNLEEAIPQSQMPRHSYWHEVRVVSVRNLRLPVKALSQYQIGTVGVDPIEPSSCLGKIRKGMLLADFSPPSSTSPLSVQSLAPHPPPSPSIHTGFVASFPVAEFPRESPSPLAIGCSAMAYIGSIRAAVKLVSAESLGNGHTVPPSMSEPDIFTLDDTSSDTNHPQGTETAADRSMPHGCDIKITIAFVSSMEWVTVGSRVLVMPTIPTSGSSSSSLSRTPSGSYGLQGLVGRVCEVLGA